MAKSVPPGEHTIRPGFITHRKTARGTCHNWPAGIHGNKPRRKRGHMNRQKFVSSLKKRFSLRLHMTLILLTTSMAGVLASKGMLAVGLHNVAARYPITVLFAYLVFFAAIKIWIWLMADAPASSSHDTRGNVLDGIDLPLPSGGSGEPAFSGGGGAFDGGGASADFGDTLGDMASGAGDALGGVGDAVGDVVGGAADDEGGLVLVIVLGLLALLLFSVLGAGVFLVWQAPAILAEAAFDAVLAAGLVRSSKRMKEPDWMGSVFRTTWKPFAVVLMLAFASGWAMHHYLPKASRMMDVIHMFRP